MEGVCGTCVGEGFACLGLMGFACVLVVLGVFWVSLGVFCVPVVVAVPAVFGVFGLGSLVFGAPDQLTCRCVGRVGFDSGALDGVDASAPM